MYSDNTTKDVTATATWSSSDSAVATVDASGNASSVAVGVVTITATMENVSGSATLTVTAATLASIAVTPTNPSFAAGTTRQLTATGTFSDNTTSDVGSQVTWSSSDTAVATVSASGLVTGVSAGTATITAASGDLSGTDTVTITAATVTSIAVTPTNPSLPAGVATQMTATATMSDNTTQDVTTQATWTSSDADVAAVTSNEVSKGLLAGVAAGTATITASFGGQAGTTTATVTDAELVSIAVTPAAPSIAAGTTVQLTATGTFSDKTTKALSVVAWTSSSTSVATINSSGLASGATAGTATITARDPVTSKTGSVTLTVTAATLRSLAITPAAPSIALGTTQQFVATGTYSDNSTQTLTSNVTWASASADVATVSNAEGSKGLATSLKQGTSAITASLGGVTSPATTLTVTAATLKSIAVTPAAPSIALGTTQQFVATGTYTDNSTQEITSSVTWDSASTDVATVSNAEGSNGLATALKVGTSAVTASLNGVTSPAITLTVTAATLKSIAVTPAAPSIALGTTQQFVATGTYTDNSTQTLTSSVTWASASTDVATISNAEGSKGLATPLKAGTSAITASLSGVSSPAVTLTVTNATLVSLSITPAAPSIALGTTQQFVATGTFSDQSTQIMTSSVTWASANTDVATISNAAGSNGLATSSAQGATAITASFGNITSPQVTLTVTAATLVSIAITPAAPTIAAGTTQQFVATGTYTDRTNQPLTSSVTWASASEAVATISNAEGSNGLATSSTQGTTAITAALGNVTSPPVTLTVTAATLVSIAVTPAAPSIAAGTMRQFAATGTYTDHTTQTLTSSVTWASANTEVATISNAEGSNGLATSLHQGTTAITATLGNVTSPPVTLTVTAATLVSISVTPPNPSIPAGLSEQFTATGRYTDNTTQDLTTQVSWSSSDATVATISNAQGSNGLATAIATGSTSITAALGQVVSSAATLTVNAQTLRSITISPANPSIPLATSQRFSAMGHYSDGEASSTADITTLVTWGSEAPLYLSISNAAGSQGLAVGLVETEGAVVVSATLGGVSGYASATVTPAALVSIAVTPITASIPKGLTQAFIATGTYTDGTTDDITTSVTWSSSDEAVTISNDFESQGLAFGADVGSATITAVQGEISGSAALQVTAATLVSIAVTPLNPSVSAGLTRQFTATGTYTDHSSRDITTAVTWVSDTSSVATVSNAEDSNGLATTYVAGTAHVTAAQGDVTSPQATLTVTVAQLVQIEVTPVSASIPNGTTQQFHATGIYTDRSTQDLTELVTWESSNTEVASLSNAGLATGLAVGGPVTISASLGPVTGAASLTVTDAVLSSIAVSSNVSVIPVTLTASFTATGTYTDSTTANITSLVTWTSSAPAVAAISNAAGTRGVATALTAGSTTVSAALGQISGSASLTVSSAQLTAILVSANCDACGNSTPAGLSLQFTATGLYSDASHHDITRFATWGTLDQSVAVVANAAGSRGLLTGLVVGSTSVFATYQAVSGSAVAVVTDAQLLAVQIDPPMASIPNGNTYQFHAVGSFTDNIPRDITSQVTWSSSALNIASISNAEGSIGLARSITPAEGHTGSTTITATDPGTGHSGSATLTVTDAVLRQIALTPPNPSLPRGTSQNLTATGTYSDSTTQNLTAAVTWSSSNPGVVGVSAGVANGLELGTATVTATDPSTGVSGSTDVTVTAAVLTSIAVEPAAPSIAKGTSVQLAATGTYSDSSTRNITADVAWTSGNEAVATVSNSAGSKGFASGADTGSTTITATVDGVSGSASITVTAATVVSIAITPETQTLAKGTTVQYQAIATFTDETTQDLTDQLNWQSSNGVVASVSNLEGSRGLATALTTGAATITATNGTVTGSASLTVTDAVLLSLSISPTDLEMPVSSTQQFTATGHFSDGTTQDLTSQSSWSTSTPSVVTISNSQGSWGLATALTPGIVTVTAASGGRTANTTATVPLN